MIVKNDSIMRLFAGVAWCVYYRNPTRADRIKFLNNWLRDPKFYSKIIDDMEYATDYIHRFILFNISCKY